MLWKQEAVADEGLVPPLEVVRHLLVPVLVDVPVVLHSIKTDYRKLMSIRSRRPETTSGAQMLALAGGSGLRTPESACDWTPTLCGAGQAVRLWRSDYGWLDHRDYGRGALGTELYE